MSLAKGLVGKKHSAPRIFNGTAFLKSSMTSTLGLFEIETFALANIVKKVAVLL